METRAFDWFKHIRTHTHALTTLFREGVWEEKHKHKHTQRKRNKCVRTIGVLKMIANRKTAEKDRKIHKGGAQTAKK